MDKHLSGLSPLWLMTFALALGVAIVVMIPYAIVGGDGVKASDWLGFAGNVASGAMTLVAAVTAWFAVQKQIAVQRELAALTETETWNLLRGDLQELAYRLNVFWKSVDRAMASPKDEKILDWRLNTVIEYVNELPDAQEIERFENAGPNLNVARRRRLLVLMFILKELRRKAEWFATGPHHHRDRSDKSKWRADKLPPIQIMLTIFAKELRQFDADLAATFSERLHAELDGSSQKERLDRSWQENLDYEETL